MTVAAALADLLPPEALAVPDGWVWSGAGRPPEAVVSPASVEEAAHALRWAAETGTSVVPAGSGRVLATGGPVGAWLLLTSARLRGLEIYEPADLTLTARAGTSMVDLARTLGEHGQWLPFDPPGAFDGSLGGLVARGASGPLWMGYGALRNHVLGMTVVTGDGRALRLGGRVVKNVAGFDLLKPMVGSRGTLAFIVTVCVRAFPRPTVERVLTLAGPDAASLVEAALRVGTAPVLPVSCVIEEGPDVPARLSVRLHGAEDTVVADARAIAEHVGEVFQEDQRPGSRITADEGRDEPWTGLVGLASVLPGRLGEVLSALRGIDVERTVVDAYAAAVRFECVTADAQALTDLRERVEELGGALALERIPEEATDLASLGSRPSPDEARIGARIAEVFDPKGVLWKARR